MPTIYKQKQFLVAIVLLVAAGIGWYLWPKSQDGSRDTSQKQTPSLSGLSAAAASEIHSACEARTSGTEIFDCYTQVLHDHIYAKGAVDALNLLQELNDLGGYAQTNCHPLSHKVGNISLHYYGTVLAASPYYLPVCYSGYYHGLLEEYLSVAPSYENGVKTACGPLGDKVYFDWFQCTHGLGHGIMQYREDDVLLSVKDCDLIDPGNLAREICYGGVFMENITTDAKTGHPSKFIKADDPIYPCNIVEAKYKSSCYFLSSSMILRLNGYDFPKGFKSCDTAEALYVYLCYQSMGRDVSGTYQRNIAKVNELCPLATKQYIGDCYFGAVRDFINEKGEFDTALPMCAATPEEYKPACYSAVNYDLGLLKSGQAYVDVCNQMPENYKQQCLALRKS